jgi:hypothetical protein
MIDEMLADINGTALPPSGDFWKTLKSDFAARRLPAALIIT